MPREFYTDVDLKGVVLLDGSAGTSGYVLKSQGSGQKPIWAPESGGLSDGDKGDITVSASGATWTIDNDAVTYAKIQNVATDRLLGRSSAGSGDIEEIVCTAAGRALLDDADAAAQLATLGAAAVNQTTYVGTTAIALNRASAAQELTGITGVRFPATRVGSADANSLDDYEEGTFTPRIDGATQAGTGTYSVQLGTYITIGALTFVRGFLTWSAHTGTGAMRLAGLPVAAASDGVGTMTYSNLTYTGSAPALEIIDGQAYAAVVTRPASNAGAGTVAVDPAATIEFSFCYRTG